MTQAFAPRHWEHDGKVRRFLPPMPRTEPTVTGAVAADRPRDTEVCVGRICLGSAARYLLAWAVIVLAVWVSVCSAAYWVLLRIGALHSLSQSAATILDAPVESNGLLAAFTWPNALAAFVLSGAALALAWFVAAMGAVLVHNALATMTHGPRVHLRD